MLVCRVRRNLAEKFKHILGLLRHGSGRTERCENGKDIPVILSLSEHSVPFFSRPSLLTPPSFAIVELEFIGVARDLDAIAVGIEKTNRAVARHH